MVPLVIQWLMLGVLAQPYRDAMVNVSPWQPCPAQAVDVLRLQAQATTGQ